MILGILALAPLALISDKGVSGFGPRAVGTQRAFKSLIKNRKDLPGDYQ